jgi:hypothetical protein
MNYCLRTETDARAHAPAASTVGETPSTQKDTEKDKRHPEGEISGTGAQPAGAVAGPSHGPAYAFTVRRTKTGHASPAHARPSANLCHLRNLWIPRVSRPEAAISGQRPSLRLRVLARAASPWDPSHGPAKTGHCPLLCPFSSRLCPSVSRNPFPTRPRDRPEPAISRSAPFAGGIPNPRGREAGRGTGRNRTGVAWEAPASQRGIGKEQE